VAAFGAFVDVGVHQDGLVHVSAMSDRYVSDPHEVVKSGQVVKVKVLEVDVDRQRIGLTLRLNDTPQQRGGQQQGGGQGRASGQQQPRGDRPKSNRPKDSGRRESAPPSGSMAEALRNAGFGR
jgi:protein Tex